MTDKEVSTMLYKLSRHISIITKVENTRDWPIWFFWDRFQYIGHSWTDTDISKIFKSCFLFHYQKYDVF